MLVFKKILDAGDVIQVMLVTDSYFSSPCYLKLRFRLLNIYIDKIVKPKAFDS